MKQRKVFSHLSLLAGIVILAPFTAQAQWATSGGNIYNTNAGNTGIGTTTPLYKLHVIGDTHIQGTTTANGNFIVYGGINWQNTNVMNCYGSKTINLNSNTWSFWNGKVGIGTTSPTEQLEVGGNISLTAAASRRIYMGGQAGGTFGIAYNSSNPNFGIFYTEGSPDYVSISPNGNANNGTVNVLGDNRVGIGTNAPENSEGWNTATEVQGAQNAKLLVSTATGSVYSGLWSHNSGIFGAPAGGLTGTWSNHPFSVITNKATRVTVAANGNVGIGTTTPGSLLDVNGNANMNSAGINTTLSVGTKINVGIATPCSGNTALEAGNALNTAISAYASNIDTGLGVYGAGRRVGLWGVSGTPTPVCPGFLDLNQTTGVVGIASVDPDRPAYFPVGVNGNATGGYSATGIRGYAASATALNYGVQGTGWNGTYAYGVKGYAAGASTANYGVYGETTPGGATTDWAGYFLGRTYCSFGVWSGSDRKLKNNIKPLEGAMDKIMALKPSSYTFKTDEYKQMNLPEGEQMGLIAQELEQVFPNLVHNNIQPEVKDKDGKIISEKVEFKCVNYTELIPALIAAMQQQQTEIKDRDEEIQSLKNEITEIKSALSKIAAGSSNAPKATDTRNDGNWLAQSIPNPTGSSAQVAYHIAENTTKAAIVLYTTDGTEVKRYNIDQKGNGSITINAGELQNGSYIYSLITNEGIADTKKMIIAR